MRQDDQFSRPEYPCRPSCSLQPFDKVLLYGIAWVILAVSMPQYHTDPPRASSCRVAFSGYILQAEKKYFIIILTVESSCSRTIYFITKVSGPCHRTYLGRHYSFMMSPSTLKGAAETNFSNGCTSAWDRVSKVSTWVPRASSPEVDAHTAH